MNCTTFFGAVACFMVGLFGCTPDKPDRPGGDVTVKLEQIESNASAVILNGSKPDRISVQEIVTGDEGFILEGFEFRLFQRADVTGSFQIQVHARMDNYSLKVPMAIGSYPMSKVGRELPDVAGEWNKILLDKEIELEPNTRYFVYFVSEFEAGSGDLYVAYQNSDIKEGQYFISWDKGKKYIGPVSLDLQYRVLGN